VNCCRPSHGSLCTCRIEDGHTRKSGKAEWATIPEIGGMFALVISVMFEVVGLERKTAIAAAESRKSLAREMPADEFGPAGLCGVNAPVENRIRT